MNRTVMLLALLAVAAPAQTPERGRREAPREGQVLAPDAVPQEQGVPGTKPPLVSAVLRPDAPVHDDTTGTALREMLELAGAPGGGFAAIWQDHRDGNMGLYFARVGLDGRPREPERAPYSKARTSRELDPAIAVGASGHGIVSWRENSMPNGYYFTRLFDAQGKLTPEHLPMGFEFPASGGRGRDAVVQPSVAALPDGSGVCVWLAAGRAMAQVIRAVGPVVEEPSELSRAGEPASTRPVVGTAANGTWLAAWGTRSGIECLVRPPRGAELRNALGAGVPLEVHSDLDGGFWILVEQEGKRVLRHADARGKVERELALDGVPIDVAIADFGALVLLAPGESRTGAHKLQIVPLEAGAEPGQPVALRSETGKLVGNVRVAAAGSVGLIAWRERRGPDHVIVARTVDAQGAFGTAHDLTSDRATSNQTTPDIASDGEDRAVCAWVDRRNGPSEVWVRLLDAERGNASPEFTVPARLADDDGPAAPIDASSPAVAMAQDERFAVAWLESREGGVAVLAQGFDADARPLGAAVAFDLGLKPGGEVILVAAPEGYVIVWTRGAGGLAARRMDFACLPLGEAQVLSADPTAANPAACRLDAAPRERDARAFAVAWDVQVAGVGRRLRACVLGSRLELQGGEIGFDTMYLGADWDPAIAPASDGGFVLFWTSGDARARDVFTRAFDADGRARTRPLAVSVRANEQDYPEIARLADGSYALVWEDDISMWDYVNVRRLSADAKTLGPTFQLCERPEAFLKAHTHGKVARFGAGLVSVWTDTRRGRGADVYWKLVGPRFDTESRAQR